MKFNRQEEELISIRVITCTVLLYLLNIMRNRNILIIIGKVYLKSIQNLSSGSAILVYIFFQNELVMKRSFIVLFVLRQVHCLFQSESSTECGLVLPLSISSNLAFP